jgi:GNAT superfamily N-acetyltransferase
MYEISIVYGASQGGTIMIEEKIKGTVVALVAEDKESLWNNQTDYKLFFAEVGAPFPPKEHLAYIKKNGGEKLVYTDGDSIFGWIGIIPNKQISSAELAGIEIHEHYRNRGIASLLIKNAEKWLLTRGINRFTFRTSPLFASNGLLYMRHCGTKYIWNSTSFGDKEKKLHCPLIDCIMDLPVSSDRSNTCTSGYKNQESIISWIEKRPLFKKEEVDLQNEFQIIELPLIDLKIVIRELQNGNTDICNTTYAAFDYLDKNGYRFLRFEPKENGNYVYILKKENNITSR